MWLNRRPSRNYAGHQEHTGGKGAVQRDQQGTHTTDTQKRHAICITHT